MDIQNDWSMEKQRVSMSMRNQEEGLSSVIERIEDISVSSEMTSKRDATVGALEWEILLAVNNLYIVEVINKNASRAHVQGPAQAQNLRDILVEAKSCIKVKVDFLYFTE
ncbi:zinc finger, RING/FYVE/PHD-type [Artemisia annua]|uniref:Zinc finger, RING/FYVE/PHD-type n=1 Tax=Artemisia annua TaxID=35608 RepID=A0A2U1L818_ARTAN|nr:zinc finger, RING/FYVE/PHD-type [Artemisia annua]